VPDAADDEARRLADQRRQAGQVLCVAHGISVQARPDGSGRPVAMLS
jgi:hypothetical protein